jgi:hypothetical protein
LEENDGEKGRLLLNSRKLPTYKKQLDYFFKLQLFFSKKLPNPIGSLIETSSFYRRTCPRKEIEDEETNFSCR